MWVCCVGVVETAVARHLRRIVVGLRKIDAKMWGSPRAILTSQSRCETPVYVGRSRIVAAMMGSIMTEKVKKVLAIASAGGHWVQLRRLRPAWDECEVVYVATNEGYRAEVMGDRARHPRSFHAVPDANRHNKIKLIRQFFSVAKLVLKTRPDVIVSTGASSGFFALVLGRLIGAKTIWVDSIANAGELSASGRMVGRHASLWLTQWSHIAEKGGPRCEGSVI